MVANVNKEDCTGCGICAEECPATAIEIRNEIAVVDADECTDCGSCVNECPSSAISMS